MKEQIVYTIYGLTHNRSKDPNKCIMFCDDIHKSQPLVTYSYTYYNHGYHLNPLAMKVEDFNYVVKVNVDPSNTYIISSKKDILDGILNDNGLVNLKKVSEITNKQVKGCIIFRTPGIIPYVYLPPECIIKSTMFQRRCPLSRLWTSVEECNDLSHFECINSQSCILKDAVNKSSRTKAKGMASFNALIELGNLPQKCTQYTPFTNLPLKDLSKVLIPYKFYSFTEYETKPYNASQTIHSHFKPHGLWFSLGNEWLNHMKKTNYNMTKYNYLYEVVFDKSKMFTITDLVELKQLSLKYGKHDKKVGKMIFSIDWTRFVKDTKASGIIIAPNLKSIVLKYKDHTDMYSVFESMEWYTTWDVASAVVWKPNAIKSFRLIYKQLPGKLVDYMNKKKGEC